MMYLHFMLSIIMSIIVLTSYEMYYYFIRRVGLKTYPSVKHTLES